MRVIKDNSKKIIRCTKCKSILEYDNNDIYSERTINGRQYVICPECNTQLDIKNTSNTIKLEKDNNNIITTIKNGCPRCDNDLAKLPIKGHDLYSCVQCGYEMEREIIL